MSKNTKKFRVILEDELKIINTRRKRIRTRLRCLPLDASPRNNLVGLALSGGGIRSAATNIGVLQGLAKSGIMQFVDYLSTVSGGGYIGACLSSLLSNNCRQGKESSGRYFFQSGNDPALFSTSWDCFPFRDDQVEEKKKGNEPGQSNPAICAKLSGNEQLGHIRNRASYLAPRPLHFSASVTRAIGSLLLTTFTHLLWFLLVITTLTSLYMAIVSLVAPNVLLPAEPSGKANKNEACAMAEGLRIEACTTEEGLLNVVIVPETAGTQQLEKEEEKWTVRLKKAGEALVDGIKKMFAAFWIWIFASPHLMKVIVWVLPGLMSCLLFVLTIQATDPGSDRGDRSFWEKIIITALSIYMLASYAIGVTGIYKPGSMQDWQFWIMLIWASTLYTLLYYLIKASGKLGTQATAADRGKLLYGYVMSTVLLLAVLSLWIISSGEGNDTGVERQALMLVPFAMVLGTLLLWFVAVIWPSASFMEKHWNTQVRSNQHLVAGALLWCLLLTFILAVLPVFFKLATWQTIGALLTALLVGGRSLVGNDELEKKRKWKLSHKYQRFLLGFVAFFIVFVAVIFVGNLITEKALTKDVEQAVIVQSVSQLEKTARTPILEKDTPRALLIIFGIAFVGFLLFTILVEANKISPHYFYRDRLSEAFLQSRNKDEIIVRDDEEMRLADLHGHSGTNGCAARGPYLLINGTLNLTASHDLKAFNRRSAQFTFSREYIGSEKTGYVQTQEYLKDEEGLKLARAMTISGAAFTSVMGGNSSLATSFACTILGVRLGYWLPNPGKARKWYDNLSRLFLELINYTHARGSEIYVSDGGHSGDNLGIMPLLRRRTKLIIVSDSEADPEHVFDSLNSSIRKAYVDEGIKVRISLEPFARDEKGYARKHFAVGRILYPDRPWQRSWILVMKNTLTGNEMAPILNYKTKSETFPHEATADQFFTEEQFESYRALGRHAAEEAFEPVRKWLEKCWDAGSNDDGHDLWTSLEGLCEKLAQQRSWEKEAWDDVLTAMWDAEQEGFQSWERFSKMMGCYNEEFQKMPGAKTGRTEQDFQTILENMDRIAEQKSNLPPTSMAHFRELMQVQ